MKQPKLYMFTGSNAVLTAQLMLAHKGVEYKRRNLPPAAHAMVVLGLGSDAMTVPALKADGRRIQGTRYIARFLDELVPERPLFPADPDRRREVEEAERWGEDFQNAVRRIFYRIGKYDTSAFRNVMLAERSFPMRQLLWVATPLILRLATAKHDALEEAVREDLAAMPARLDRIDAWIAEGVLDGPELNAADFQIAPSLAAVLLSEDAAPYLEGRPAQGLARRVAPDYSGKVGKALMPGTVSRALPTEWLPPLELSSRETQPQLAQGADSRTT